MLEGLAYHITQRGNGRQQVFFGDSDYLLYRDLLRSNALQSGLVLWAYCVMPNHIHLIAVPNGPQSMARALGRTHADYARHYNLQRRSCGHVWQARFYSCPLENAHLWRAMAYVERNPTRANLVAEAGQYPWSSASAHVTGSDGEELLDLRYWSQYYTPARWAEVLRTNVEEEQFGERLHQATRHGRPLGDEQFVKELEVRSGRVLRPRSPGRPRKESDASLAIGS